jgi:hypothetical protein
MHCQKRDIDHSKTGGSKANAAGATASTASHAWSFPYPQIGPTLSWTVGRIPERALKSYEE